MPERFRLAGAVILILIQDGRILLGRRTGTGWEDGKFGPISGHIEGNESFTAAAVREAREEVGVLIQPQDLRFVHLSHSGLGNEHANTFFVAEKWQGEPRILEPELCDMLDWFPLDDLPRNLVVGTREVLARLETGEMYSEEGFDAA